jgi:hypothetical protein
MALTLLPDDDDLPDTHAITPAPNTGAAQPLPTWTLNDILAYEANSADEIWGGGVLSANEPAAIIGSPGTGKSRFALQAAICTILGRQLLIWATNAPGSVWLFLQTENNGRRLKHDLSRMIRGLSDAEKALVNQCLHIVNIDAVDFGSICMAPTSPDRERIAATIAKINPLVVVIDPLRDAGRGDPNKDEAMTETCQAIRAMVREGNPRRVPLVIHHGRTGSVEAVKVFGDDADSFGRNSKVLYGFLRSQINVAAAGVEHPGVVVFGCGKNSNGPKWDPFAAQLDEESMTYSVLDDFDLDAWRDGSGPKSKKSAPKKKPTPEEVADLVRKENGKVEGGDNDKDGLVWRTRKAFGVTRDTAKAAVKSALGITIQRVGGDRIGGTQRAVSYVLKDAA